jgi:type VI secretion system protein ImpK
MSDNPFGEPDDSERTVIRPVPGGRRPPEAAPPGGMQPGPGAGFGGQGGSGGQGGLPPAGAGFAAPSPTLSEGAEQIRFGTSPLLAAAAPLLQLLARLRNTLSQPDASELRERAVREIRQFEASSREAQIPMELLRPAHYALCASLDDAVLNTPWGSQSAWDTRSLVSTFHQEVRSGERFFAVLAQLRQNPGSFLPVLDLMYMCLALGFQGQYRLTPRGPAELDRIREDLYTIITRQRGAVEAGLSPHWQGVAAPYRPARARLPLWVACVAGLLVMGLAFLGFSRSLNASSDALFEAMLTAPPAAMPRLVRAAPVVPPPPPPPPAQPGILEKLRQFLAPEIKEGLVTVLGTEEMPVVRIRNTGMFASGSATVEAKVIPTLERIGTALKSEPGQVTVLGYTDNQPIHTVQFPSNFVLSTKRAEAARAIILKTLGEPARIRAEGRAEADPIATNATAAGRDENRRIEVVLRRQG